MWVASTKSILASNPPLHGPAHGSDAQTSASCRPASSTSAIVNRSWARRAAPARRVVGGRPRLPVVSVTIGTDDRRQLEAAVAVVGGVLGGYLYGSAVSGGLRHGSDLDLLVISGRSTTRHE